MKAFSSIFSLKLFWLKIKVCHHFMSSTTSRVQQKYKIPDLDWVMSLDKWSFPRSRGQENNCLPSCYLISCESVSERAQQFSVIASLRYMVFNRSRDRACLQVKCSKSKRIYMFANLLLQHCLRIVNTLSSLIMLPNQARIAVVTRAIFILPRWGWSSVQIHLILLKYSLPASMLL